LDACQRLRTLDERRAGKGAPVKLVIYPGAYHALTHPLFVMACDILANWVKYDADAAQRSVWKCMTSGD